MYSRKFNQSSIPPDYSGVSFRQREYEMSTEPYPQEEDRNSSPRYPVEDRHCPSPAHKFKFKPTPGRKAPAFPPKKTDETAKESKYSPSTGSLLSHSFTMEDIVLAGLILLLLNSECDNELLLVLGFLLLVGLQ